MRGDLHVRVMIETMSGLSPQQRSLILQLQEHSDTMHPFVVNTMNASEIGDPHETLHIHFFRHRTCHLADRGRRSTLIFALNKILSDAETDREAAKSELKAYINSNSSRNDRDLAMLHLGKLQRLDDSSGKARFCSRRSLMNFQQVRISTVLRWA